MEEYLKIYHILNKVFQGKNLADEFDKAIISNKTNNIGKIKDICYGATRNYFVLKNIIKELIHKNTNKQLLLLLYISLYELIFTKKPVFAVVNDSVNFSKIISSDAKVKNFINATLRRYLRDREEINKKLKTKNEYKFNFPVWLINKIKNTYPVEYLSIIENFNKKPNLTLRVNIKKTTLNEYIQLLEQNNLNYQLKDEFIILENNLTIDKIPLFKEGFCSVQDINAGKLNQIIKFKPNQYILDACAAPGGKACQILERNSVELVALEIDSKRITKLKQNLERLDLHATIINNDATKADWWDKRKFDTIIADVPCSASGTIRKNPDIKINRKKTDIEKFIKTQQQIVINLWQMLKDNGHMLYITCSIFKEENQQNISTLLKKLDKVRLIKEIQFLPGEYGDGFYYCLLQKIDEK